MSDGSTVTATSPSYAVKQLSAPGLLAICRTEPEHLQLVSGACATSQTAQPFGRADLDPVIEKGPDLAVEPMVERRTARLVCVRLQRGKPGRGDGSRLPIRVRAIVGLSDCYASS